MKIETQSMADGLERPEGALEAERQGQHTLLSPGNCNSGCNHVLIGTGMGFESAAGLTGMTSWWQRTPVAFLEALQKSVFLPFSFLSSWFPSSISSDLWVFPIAFLSDWLQLGKIFILYSFIGKDWVPRAIQARGPSSRSLTLNTCKGPVVS